LKVRESFSRHYCSDDPDRAYHILETRISEFKSQDSSALKLFSGMLISLC